MMEATKASTEDIVISEETINLRAVFLRKNPRLARMLPGFVYGFFDRLLHVRQLNDILWRHRDRYGIDFITSVFDEFGVEVHVENAENIPESGAYTIASNHPLGGLDGMALLKQIGEVRPDVLILSNDILMFLPNMRMLFAPVNTLGKNTEYIATLRDFFSSDRLVCFFPAGLVSRKQGREIRDLEWKPTFITQSIKHRRDIIPVFIDGHNSAFFYNFAFWRKRLGIKTNLEMFLLVHEMFSQKDKKINIIFGHPVSYKVFDKSRKAREWAALFRDHVYALGAGKPGVLTVLPPEEEFTNAETDE